MKPEVSGYNSIILIGLKGVGKSTAGELLAKTLNCPFTSLDGVDRKYMKNAGFDEKFVKRIRQSERGFERYEYIRSFFDEAVVQFLDEYQAGVLELGAGHPIVPNSDKQRRITEALRPYKNVVLLLPTQDLLECVNILKPRNRLKPEHRDMNDLFILDNTFYDLAKFVVYTHGRTLEQTCQDLLDALGF